MTSADPTTIATHLKQLFEPCIELYPDGLVEIRCICPGAPSVVAKLFSITKAGLGAATHFASEQNASGKNVYVGVNPRKPGTKRDAAGDTNDVEIAFHCFGDFDSNESTTRLAQFINTSGTDVLYSFAVTTGRIPSKRVHAYWRLEEPVRNLKSWTQAQKGIASYFSGDSVIDPPRIMRLAGTISYPTAKKSSERGYVTELTTIRTDYDQERPPVSMEALLHRFQIAPGDTSKNKKDPSKSTRPGHGFPAAGLDRSKAFGDIANNCELHNNTRNLAASFAHEGRSAEWIENKLLLALEPVSDGGTIQQVPSLVASAISKFAPKSNEVLDSSDGYDLTEDGIAQAYRDRYGERLRFDHDQSAWYEWMGSHWSEDCTKLAFDRARNLARELSADMEYSVRRKIGRATVAASVERFARADREFAVTSDNWDSDPFQLGTPGGTVDLRTGKLRLSVPWEGITKLTAVAPDPHAKCPVWKAFLQDTTRGDDDLIEFLARMVGYSLTGDTREHALFYIHGPGGNGKSVFLNTVAGILGDYARVSAMETFTARRNEGHPTELAMLRGARLVHASETEEGRAWAESRIKTLTGGEKISARFMRQDFFEFIPQFKLAIVGNHKPVLRSVDDAARRRFNIIPFVHKPTEPDKELEDKLRAEWPAILQWAIEGCMRWQESGLTRPAIVASATDNYFADQDLFGQWLDEMCDLRSGHWESVATLFKSWGDYAKSAAEDAGTKKSFGGTMEKHGLLRDRKNKIRGFAGVRLQDSYEAVKWEGGDR